MSHLMKIAALTAVLVLPASADAATFEWRYTGTIGSGVLGLPPMHPGYALTPAFQIGSVVDLRVVVGGTGTPVDQCQEAGAAYYGGLPATLTVGGVPYTGGAAVEIGRLDGSNCSSNAQPLALRMFGNLLTLAPGEFPSLGFGMYGSSGGSVDFPTSAPGTADSRLYVHGNVYHPSPEYFLWNITSRTTTQISDETDLPAPAVTTVAIVGCLLALARRRSRT